MLLGPYVISFKLGCFKQNTFGSFVIVGNSKLPANVRYMSSLTVFFIVQRILFSVMKGTGHEVELLGAVVETLQHLLERRSRHHLQMSSESIVDKLSPAEVDLLDALLQVLHDV